MVRKRTLQTAQDKLRGSEESRPTGCWMRDSSAYGRRMTGRQNQCGEVLQGTGAQGVHHSLFAVWSAAQGENNRQGDPRAPVGLDPLATLCRRAGYPESLDELVWHQLGRALPVTLLPGCPDGLCSLGKPALRH